MESILATFKAVGELMKIKFGLRFEEVTGDVLIDVVTTTLKGMTQSPGQKAITEYYVARYKAVGTALNSLIAQPSSADQAKLASLEAELQQLEVRVSA